MQLDRVRRVLGFLLVASAVVGIMPLIPTALGFYSATVSTQGSGSYFPTTVDPGFISCQQEPATLTITKNQTYNDHYIRCSNNWGTDVVINWSDATNGITISGSSGTIPAGVQNLCVKMSVRANQNTNNGTVIYYGTVDTVDLWARITFTGVVDVKGSQQSPGTCTN